jgi:uncharacterized protein with FMN-binding domain
MNKKMVALCALAVSTIYATGYGITDLTNQTKTESKQVALAQNSTFQQQTNQQTNNISTSSNKDFKYKDGKYTGSGSNRIGSVDVAITIKSGKISDVQITRSTTSYPEEYIKDLPSEVIQRQSANVDVVSGATKSTQDFETAINQALAQA